MDVLQRGMVGKVVVCAASFVLAYYFGDFACGLYIYSTSRLSVKQSFAIFNFASRSSRSLNLDESTVAEAVLHSSSFYPNVQPL